ncbi:MAG: hypothetical protein K0U41_06685 [Gammaproteobacteria bacterium]|nr:hypothetical protein [Gammaproteobacteria bacterium]
MNAVKELAQQLEDALRKLESNRTVTKQYAIRCEELYNENERLKEMVKKYSILLNKDLTS